MDWYPLWNSLRIAAVSTVIIFFLGILAAYYVAKLPRLLKGVLDVILTLPLVLPPTVVGYFLLRLLGPKRTVGLWFLEMFDVRLTMVWYSAIFASAVVAFPLMYRTARGAFEAFDKNLAYAGQTLGRSNTWIFWRVRMPCCKQGIIAGTVLAFARALGEYGATSMIAGLYARQDRHHIDHGVPALAHRRRRRGHALGAREPRHLRRRPARREHAREEGQAPETRRRGRHRGGGLMSLLVDIKKDFGRFKLDAHFEAESGSVTGLLGASGCGKSVTLKCVAGIEKPDEGRIVLDGASAVRL